MAWLSLYKRRHQRSVPLGFKAVLDYIFGAARAANCFLLLFSLCLGKYYYEVTCHDQGLCRVGWSTSQAALDLGMFSYCLMLHNKYSPTEQLCNFYMYIFSQVLINMVLVLVELGKNPITSSLTAMER